MSILGQIIFYLFLIAIPTIAIYLLYRSKNKKERIAWYKSKKNIVLSVLVPRENEKKPIAAEQLFASLHGIYRAENKWQDQISFEIVSKDKYVQFYIYLPEYLKDFVEGQIYAQYSDVEIYQVPDYTKEDFSKSVVASTQLKLVKPEVYPIKSFTSFEVDPLAAITAVMSEVSENEQIWVQIIIEPISDVWQIKGISHVAAIKSGHSSVKFNLRGIGKLFFSLMKEIFQTLFSPTTTQEGGASTAKTLSGPEEEALKEIERKSTKLGFATKIRIIAIAKDHYTARSKLESIAGAFKQFSTTNLNSFYIDKIYNNLPIINIYRERKFYSGGFILNIEELASVYHLPTKAVETPNIVWAGSKKGEPPSNLPIVGSVQNQDLTLLAKTDFRNIEKIFGIKRKDRNLHMYIVGKTGTGKSTMLENMVIDDIRKGQGVAYIDPHGDAIENIINHIPKERIQDVVYFNPADKEWPVGFNPLEAVDPELKNIVASGVVGIFKKIFGESWGPRLEYILRNALLACVDYPGSTLLSVMRLLTDKMYRDKVINTIDDPVIRDFFSNEYNKYDPKFQREAIAPIQNKVGQFLSSSTIRNIVGQPKSTIDLGNIMDSKKIFLMDLSVGKIGEDNSALMGSMLITKFQLAAMQRAKIAVEKRKNFYLYVDEFQNFATESFAVILSEARKYRLNLTMTNQYIAQMPEEVAKAIFGNVGTIISFRVGAQDASALVKEFEPVFVANDLINLNNYNIYVKMAIDGVTRPAFSAITLEPLSKGKPESDREEIIASSRNKYARPRVQIEEEIKHWNEEIEKAHVEDDEKKKSKNRPRMFTSSPAVIEEENTINKDYYSFVDKNGQRWYIPHEDKFEKNIKKLDKKDKDNLSKEGIKEEKEVPTPRQNVKGTESRPEKYHFGPLIKPELEDDLKKMHHKIAKNQDNDDFLVSIEELEKYLSKKDNNK